MAAQQFLMSHGEKVAFAIVAVFCLWWVLGTLGDEGSRTKVSQQEFNALGEQISNAWSRPGTPNLRQPRDFYGRMQARFGLRPEAQPVMVYLHEHPHIFQGGAAQSTRAFVYEVGLPVLEVRDQIGALQVQATLSVAQRPNGEDDWVKDLPTGARWSRAEVGAGEVVNSARVAAVQIQWRQGDGEWQPLRSPEAPLGIYPVVERGQIQARLTEVEAWRSYRLRARNLVAATAASDLAARELGRETLVLTRPLPLTDTSRARLPNPADFYNALRDLQQQGQLQLASRLEQRPEGLALRSSEVLMAGSWSPPVSLRAASSIRMAVDRVSAGVPQHDMPASATLLLSKQVKDAEGKVLGFIPVQTMRIEAGQQVGDWVLIPEGHPLTPNRARRANLTTPFELVEVRRGVERVLFHELFVRSALGETGATRRLVSEPMTRNTDIAVLRNTATGELLELPRLMIIPRPRPGRESSPQIPDEGLNERELFAADPMAYEPALLQPPAPIKHEDRAILTRLGIDANRAGLIDLPIFELPDGRIIYYADVDRRIFADWLPGAKSIAEQDDDDPASPQDELDWEDSPEQDDMRP